jgi:hypothetical protein
MQKMRMAPATIFWHVGPDDSSYDPRMVQWIDNFECLIVAFSWDLE